MTKSSFIFITYANLANWQDCSDVLL